MASAAQFQEKVALVACVFITALPASVSIHPFKTSFRIFSTNSSMVEYIEGEHMSKLISGFDQKKKFLQKFADTVNSP